MACCYSSCGNTSASDLKRCGGCREVRYCSSRCQKLDWPSHVFDCKTGKPICTVYYLVRDMKNEVLPCHHQTRIDYGFDKGERMLGAESLRPICQLYHQLVGMLADPYADLRRWQKEGMLVEGIKQVFARIPPHRRGAHYRWFLEHQYVFDGSPADEGMVALQAQVRRETWTRAAWLYAGGSSSDPMNTIYDHMARGAQRSEHKLSCLLFVSYILDHDRPSPKLVMWLTFGFIAGHEPEISRCYTELLGRCTFEEICEAYETSSIPALFARHGVMEVDRDRDRYYALFADVMSGSPTTFKSVWHLKRYIYELDPRAESRPLAIPPCLVQCVIDDYGYGNCKKNEEWKLLDELYTQLFMKHEVDPLALHDACLQGELLQFAKGFMKLSPWTATYTRMLKNMYPLPDCKELMYVV